MPWDTSCPGWEEKLLSGQSLVPALPLYEDQAAKALRIFKRFRVPDLIGTPRMGDVCGPWFFDIVEAVFGCYDPITHFRHIQEFFILVSKGNAKTSYSAALFLVALIMNERPKAEFHFVAPTKNIATYAFDQAANTIRLDPELKKIFHIQGHLKTITHHRTGALLQVKAADTDVITGGKQVATLVDETHEFAQKSDAGQIFVEIRGALGKRPDGFLIQTSTQSKLEPAGVFKQELVKARAVRDGEIQFPLLPILYELPKRLIKSNEWRDEKYWPLINPNLHRSVRLDFLRRTLQDADEKGPVQLALVASQHWAVEIGIGLSTDAWEGVEYWLEAGDPTITIETLIKRCDVVCAGIDGGGLDDLLGLCLAGRERSTRKWLLWNRAWCHPKVLKIRKEIAPKLLDLQNLGQLFITGKVGQDVTELVDILFQIEEAGLFPEKGAIGVDPVGITDIIDELERREFDVTQEGGRIVGIQQGWTLTNIIKTLARRLASGECRHAAQALMTWCVGNAKIEPRGNAITITKQVSGKAKIDPLMATFNATTLISKNPESTKGKLDAFLSSGLVGIS